ncbi:very short patch repair endonuclease [Emergencia sp.]|uniref:very short patch repair endonuclease n=1 Tax=Emergencia sp. TaxID=1926557 RepID=UPI003AF00786
MTDVLTPEQRHKAMKNIKRKDTKIELKLRKALWEAGYHYRKNYKGLPGTPDIAFTKYKIAVFCDSEFFHGKDWDKLKEKLKSSNNSEYWLNKIETNINRDKRIDAELDEMGWRVIHFWGNDILRDVDGCVKQIGDVILGRLVENNYQD